MDFMIKVKPEELKAQAAVISSEVQKIDRQWKHIETLVNRSKSYWEGDASGFHLKCFEEIKEPVQTLLAKLREHPTDLIRMAGIYTSTEKENIGLSNALPNDVIQ